MELNTKTVTELKAIAYDLLVEAEQTQKNIQIVNQVIAKKLEEELKEPTPSEDK
jgi:hypothetical protein